ncbi:MAG: hypothetical protein IKP35_03690 [Alphaproteobacteria bacterium]|nr:hypothetical protein [Alphaproteobacteria bacterium]
MKKYAFFTLCLVLLACTINQPKTIIRATDFYNYINNGESINSLMASQGDKLDEISKNDITVQSNDFFTSYTYNITGTSKSKDPINILMTWNEQELDLGGYSFGYMDNLISGESWIEKRCFYKTNEGYTFNNPNLFRPKSGSILTGDTMAYIKSPNANQDPTKQKVRFIKGKAKLNVIDEVFKYELTISFDDYYTFVFDTDRNFRVSGKNMLGDADFDIPTGDYHKNYKKLPPYETDYGNDCRVKDGDTENIFGKYSIFVNTKQNSIDIRHIKQNGLQIMGMYGISNK